MTALSDRLTLPQSFGDSGNTITAYAKKPFDEEKKICENYRVSMSNQNLYFVGVKETNLCFSSANARRVTTDTLGCSCVIFLQMGIPCRHIQATLVFINQAERIMEAFDKPYVVQQYAACLSSKFIELALNDNLVSDPGILPSPLYRAAGRRQTRRVPSRGKKPSVPTFKCRICHKADGHNRQTCAKHSKLPANRVPMRPVNFSLRSHSVTSGLLPPTPWLSAHSVSFMFKLMHELLMLGLSLFNVWLCLMSLYEGRILSVLVQVYRSIYRYLPLPFPGSPFATGTPFDTRCLIRYSFCDLLL
jgi:hypothetical protein